MSEPIKEYGPVLPEGTLEAVLRAKPGPVVAVESGPEFSWKALDPRLPIIAQMAAIIFTEMVVYHSARDARRLAVDEAFLLYGEITVRLAENDR